jgi:hypothetical protein
VLALASTNAIGVILFGVLYVVAALHYMSQAAFLACLLVLFVLVTGLWLRVEARHRDRALLGRVGRIAAGLLAVIVVVPVAVLMPVFWLAEQLPVEAGLHARRGAIMFVILAALALIVIVNVVGGTVVTARATLARGRGGARARRTEEAL